jgi:hypothetical protein
MRTLEDRDRIPLTWSQLVSIWQVIGRLVRGGCPARVYFCDAAFAPRSADKESQPDDERSSLLIGMQRVLRSYLEANRGEWLAPEERAVAKVLYEPLYTALSRMKGVSNAYL